MSKARPLAGRAEDANFKQKPVPSTPALPLADQDCCWAEGPRHGTRGPGAETELHSAWGQ